MKIRKLFTLVLVLAIAVMLLPATVLAEETAENDLSQLIAELPEVSDPLGTKYYFYNQLSDLEKVLYWKMSEATWEEPSFTITGMEAYSDEELNIFGAVTVTALTADNPRCHMLWSRKISIERSESGNAVTFQMQQLPGASEYLIEKSLARVQQIVGTVGMEGDRYSRLADLMELLHNEMDYQWDAYLAGGSSVVFSYNSTAIGCLTYDLAICGGFSDTVKILCDELQIPCICVANAAHAWNFVQMEDGLWYSVDAACDFSINDDPTHFLLGENSTAYVISSNYQASELYLYSMDDGIVFPDLASDTYLYNGTYEASYHDVESTFTEPSPTFVYSVNEDGETCTITAYQGPQSGDLVIPEAVDGYMVTAIGECAFFCADGFTGDLIIADTVKEIGDGAFQLCDGLTGNLYLSDNLVSIGARAFQWDWNLTGNLVLPDSLVTIGEEAFLNCTGFTGELILPENLKSANNAFAYCSGLNGTLYLPDGMEWSSALISRTSIREIHVNETNDRYMTHEGILYSKNGKTLIACPGGKSGSISIPDSVEYLGDNALAGCTQLSGTLVLPDGLKKIGDFAVQETGFTGDLIIPDSVESIGQWAFSSSKFDGKLSLPDRLERIEEGTFMGCSLTGELIIPESVTYIGKYAMMGCAFEGILSLPESIEYIGGDAFGGTFTGSLDLSASDVVLEERAMCGVYLTEYQCNCDSEYFRTEYGASCAEDYYILHYCSHCLGGYREYPEPTEHAKFIMEVVEPTCTQEGYTTNCCQVCRTVYTDSFVEPLGHSWDSGKVTAAPAVGVTGQTTYTCTTCGGTKTEVIPALPDEPVVEECTHASTELRNKMDATCVTVGYTGDLVCINCNEVLESGAEIAMTAHTEIVDAAVAATCTDYGKTEGKHCSACNAVLAEQQTIAALGHAYDNDQDATCNRCGESREIIVATTPMYRLYNPNSGEHFYTGSIEERDNLVTAGWNYEGIAWNAPTQSGAPVYRLYNPNSGDHHYTMSAEERDNLVDVGWQYEGVAWNSATADNLPLYRLYNPNADCGSHHYTGSEEERDFLVSLGWIFEGIGWFGMLR